MDEKCPPCRLNDSVLRHLGGKLCARPVYGWGWGWAVNGKNDDSDAHVDVPPVFHFRLESFFDWNNEKRGGIGQIQELNHPYNNWWILFYTRICGVFDFDSSIADYNFHLGINRPELHSPDRDPLMAVAWPLPNFPECRSIWGFGKIAVTHEIIVNFEETEIRKWQKHSRGQ
jgi:hypothetical protein